MVSGSSATTASSSTSSRAPRSVLVTALVGVTLLMISSLAFGWRNFDLQRLVLNERVPPFATPAAQPQTAPTEAGSSSAANIEAGPAFSPRAEVALDNRQLDSSPLTFAWQLSAQLEGANLSSRNTLATRVRELFPAAATGTRDAAVCPLKLSDGGVKWRRREHQRRTPRRGQLPTIQLFETVAREANSTIVLWPSVPAVVNQYPLHLQRRVATANQSGTAPLFDLSVPFGSWKVSFTADPGKVARPPQQTPPEPPLYVAVFPQGMASQGHALSCDGGMYTAGGCLWDFSTPTHHTSWAAARDRVPIAIPLCDSWCKGYYHFTHEHLPRLALVHQLLMERSDAFLVLSHAPTSFQNDFLLDVLGIHKRQIRHGTAAADLATVYPMPLKCGNTFTSALYLLRELVFKRLELDPGSKRSFQANSDEDETTKLRVLWAERRKGSRMAANWEELKASLQKEFEPVAVFDSTVGEHHARVQVAKFFHSDIVIGPHGANIANIMWMQHGTHVIEVSSRAKGNMCYYTTASRLNLTYHLMLHGAGKDDKYVIAYADLRRHFRRAARDIAEQFRLPAVLRRLRDGD